MRFFTAKQLRVSAVSMISLKMKFEGGPLVQGTQLCRVAWQIWTIHKALFCMVIINKYKCNHLTFKHKLKHHLFVSEPRAHLRFLRSRYINFLIIIIIIIIIDICGLNSSDKYIALQLTVTFEQSNFDCIDAWKKLTFRDNLSYSCAEVFRECPS